MHALQLKRKIRHTTERMSKKEMERGSERKRKREREEERGRENRTERGEIFSLRRKGSSCSPPATPT